MRKFSYSIGNDEPEKWSSQDKFLIVLETSGMSETDLAEYARQKGLYVEQIAEWRDACINANGGMARMARSLNAALKEKEHPSGLPVGNAAYPFGLFIAGKAVMDHA